MFYFCGVVYFCFYVKESCLAEASFDLLIPLPFLLECWYHKSELPPPDRLCFISHTIACETFVPGGTFTSRVKIPSVFTLWLRFWKSFISLFLLCYMTLVAENSCWNVLPKLNPAAFLVLPSIWCCVSCFLWASSFYFASWMAVPRI